MKKITLSLLALVLMTAACKKTDKAADEATAASADTTSVKEEAAAPPMDSAAVAKAWEDYMTPGDVHKNLAMDNGTWTEETTMWMEPGGEPTKGTMTAESKMILGGRYQETVHKGSFMGMPFEGISTIGYDNASKKMVSSWVDNMGTGIMHMTADYDGTSKSMEFKGEVTDPITKKAKPSREIFTLVDNDTRKMEMFDVTPDGKEFKTMEIIMRRKK
ncbi:MAG TPA: DUF1579 domain-containing protein [Flavobacterium sp.]|jgi:hypothetical protein